MIEGSGSVSLTNKSGFGSGRGLKTYGSYGSGLGTMEETLLRNGTFQNIPKTRALPIIFQPRVVHVYFCIYNRMAPFLQIRIRTGSEFNWASGSGLGVWIRSPDQAGKNWSQKKEKSRNLMFEESESPTLGFKQTCTWRFLIQKFPIKNLFTNFDQKSWSFRIRIKSVFSKKGWIRTQNRVRPKELLFLLAQLCLNPIFGCSAWLPDYIRLSD